ncbi:helix-turn-helix transcriptional regulator [Mucilaginibacter sp.]|uniref:helix-turn-helix domain-containing protein n=1 Tax=Mucilaginibacter sp. TaxID=1882438 RepID=UPI0025FFBA69|nr:helix-turn-helix transcriptional regulator [Mucilaginibacter sp.]
MYGPKIRLIREIKGYSQEYVAGILGMTQPSYSRIETNQTKLDTGTLEKLAEILEVSPADIMSTEPTVINFYGTNHGAQCTFGTVGHFDGSQKELLEKIIVAKDEEIARLNDIIKELIKKK